MNIDYVKIITTVVLAVIGWLIAHWFTSQRDVKNKKRELRLTYLINAYNILTCEISHRPESKERALKLENAISEIQLFGNPKQIKLAQALAEEVAAGKEFQLDPLINNLRDELRGELNLKSIEGNVKWLRFNDK